MLVHGLNWMCPITYGIIAPTQAVITASSLFAEVQMIVKMFYGKPPLKKFYKVQELEVSNCGLRSLS